MCNVEYLYTRDKTKDITLKEEYLLDFDSFTRKLFAERFEKGVSRIKKSFVYQCKKIE